MESYYKKGKKNKKKVSENSSLTDDDFDINILKKYLKEKIPHLSIKDYNVVYSIFGQKEEEYLNLIKNVKNEKRGDSIICYGNNNQILKVFIDKAIKNFSLEINIKKIEINGYFDTNEETLLKDIRDSLGIESKAGYDNYKKALDNYFLKKTHDDSMIIIYCDYIEHLVHKKKQRLLYTLFELVNKSKNILLIGFTYNYNLMDQMEKRIRSRSSQKTLYINIDNYESVINCLEKFFEQKSFSNNNEDDMSNKDDESSNNIDEIENEELWGNIGTNFLESLVSDENYEFVNYIQKLVKMGISIEGILTKIQYYFLLVQVEIEKHQKDKKTNKISKVDLALMLNNIIKDIIKKEKSGYTYNMLCKCSKFQLTLFICLTSCVSHYSDKILLPNFYNHFKGITSKYLAKRSHYDLILIQKYLEDLNNCNLISIKNDEKYGKIYQLKLPLCEIRKIIRKLKDDKLLDTEMVKLCDNIKW